MTLRVEQSRDGGTRSVGHLRDAPTARTARRWRSPPSSGRFLATDDPEHDHPAADQRHAGPRRARASSRRACWPSSATICRSTCPRSRRSAPAAARDLRNDDARTRPHRAASSGTAAETRGGAARQLPFPPGRGGDDVPAAAAGAGAGGAAEAIDLGARRVPVDRADRDPAQDQRICRGARRARRGRSGDRLVGAVPAVRRRCPGGCIARSRTCPAASRSARSSGSSAKVGAALRRWLRIAPPAEVAA